MSAIGGRAVVAALALLVLGWFAVLLHDERLRVRALDQADARDVPGAIASLGGAQRLNPDASLDVLRASLVAAVPDRARAVADLRAIVRREPDNLQAWTTIYGVAAGYDAALHQRALQEIRRLDPVGARGRARAIRRRRG